MGNVYSEIVQFRGNHYDFGYVQGELLKESPTRKVVARKSNISTNHFEVLTEENRYRMNDSLRRQKELEKNHSGDLNVYQAYKILNEEAKEIFSSNYGASAGTIHTSAYVPRERKALFAIGGDRMPVIFDFNRFLEGENSNIKRIKGTLHYDSPFINMGKIKNG